MLARVVKWWSLSQGLGSLEKKRLRRAQRRTVIDVLPLTLVGNISVLLTLAIIYFGKEQPTWHFGWLSIMIISVAIYSFDWFITRRAMVAERTMLDHPATDTAAPDKVKANSASVSAFFARTHAHALVNGVLWGVAVIGLVAGSPSSFYPVLSVGIVLVFGGATITLCTIPTAALSFIVPVSIGCLAAIFMLPPTPATYSMAAITVWIAFACPLLSRYYSATFARTVRGIQKTKEQSALVSMLLSELQQNSSDWIWEADENGLLTRFPEEMLPKELVGKPVNVAGYFERVSTIKGSQLQEVLKALKSHSAFNDSVLCINWGRGENWIRLNGHPVLDDDGAVSGFVGTGSDVTSEKLAEDRIATLSQLDALTGLMNRTAFSERLSQAVANLERYGRPFTVLYLDLDGFKLINDTRGHLTGDRLLAETSERIADEVREGDCVARLNGDEFAILMDSQGDAGAAARLAARLIGEVNKPYHIDNDAHRVGLSIGIAMAPLNGTRPDQLLRNADLALYRAKADGRGVFRFFENDMDAGMRERRMLESELGAAIKNDELVLHYQPLVDAKTGETLGMESLIRWQHPLRGLLSPFEFIELAEQSNMICDIGKWTIMKACMEAKEWPSSVFVAVNLSAHHFIKSDICEEVSEALAASGISPERLELEITESMLIDDTKSVVEKLHQVKELGVSVAMDDFGTGYSSLSYLMSVPFDKLKIDKSFVDEVDQSDAGRKIVKMITKLAKELSLKVTAEGVEEEAQARFLSRCNCDTLQGYLFSKPMPSDALPGYFLESRNKFDWLKAYHDEQKTKQREVAA